jgi:hypothetical protein
LGWVGGAKPWLRRAMVLIFVWPEQTLGRGAPQSDRSSKNQPDFHPFMSEIHETLEQAEHAGHGGHGGGHSDPMMMRVAMTMAIIAATLAAVSVAGHRKHNAVLQLQGEANRLLTEAAGLKVEASNTFARYQSKRARVEEQERSVAFTKLFAAREGSEAFREE